MKTRHIGRCIIAAFLVLPSIAAAQVGTTFPTLTGEKANHTTETIPEDTKGKYTLIGVAYSEDAERDLRSWYQPTYAQFLDKNGINAMVYDANVRLVLMFTGINKAATNKAIKNMEKMADPELMEHVIFYKGELKTYKKALKLEDKKRPYLFVLDQDGKIIHATSGRYSVKKMEALSEPMEL